jgi:uncharacterized membrane protein (UPF0127 family)
MNKSLDRLPKWSLVAGAVTVVLGTCISALALLFGVIQQEHVTNPNQVASVSYQSTTGQTYVVNVELAITPEQHQRGLMNRRILDSDSGMLFVFSNTEIRTFWMKDTFIPLDMVFLDDTGKVVTIFTNTIPNQTYQRYTSALPAKYVLETSAGWVAKTGLKVGDFLTLNI